MKQFINKESYRANDVIQVLDELSRAKTGINSSDILYKDFMVRLNDAVKNKFNAGDYEEIALKAYYLNIKDPLFWFSLDNSVKTAENNMDFQTLLVVFSIFLRIHSYPHFYRYMSGFKDELLEATKKSLAELDFRHVIHASYIFGALSTPFPELTKKLKTDLTSSLKNPNSVDVSINDLATAGVLVSTILRDDSEREALLKALGNYLNTLDLKTFATPSENTKEYDEELLNWHSVAFLVRVFGGNQATNEGLVKKINDVILFKSEIDPIDFESASIILSVLSKSGKETDNVIVQRLLERVHTLLAEEGSAMFSQFDGRNVASFLKSAIVIAKKGQNKEILEEFIEYFSGLIRSDKIASKIELEDLSILRKVFEEAKQIGNVDQELFTHIQKRIEKITAQRKKEEAGQH